MQDDNKNGKLDFIFIATPKSGTTSLALTLGNHPDLCLPIGDESWFFEKDNFCKGLNWYETNFKHCKNSKVKRGEVTTTLIFDIDIIDKLKQVMLKGAKIVIVLRDPIKSCISTYLHLVRTGKEKRSLDEAVKDELKKLETCSFSLEKFENLFGMPKYVAPGLFYAYTIPKIFKVFPKSDIKIFFLKEILEDQSNTLERIYKFIGVDGDRGNKVLENVNVARISRWSIITTFLESLSYYFNKFSRRVRKLLRKNSAGGILGGRISGLFTILIELTYREMSDKEKPILSKENRDKMEYLYNSKLSGLQSFTKTQINRYWSWYKNY